MKGDEHPKCGGCGLGDQWVLFNVRHRGDYLRLCTSCVLKFHPGLFCPVCFEVYDAISTTPNDDRVKCFKCSSASSHTACVAAASLSGEEKDLLLRTNSSAAYVCPSCSNPSSVIFYVGKKRRRSGGGGVSVSSGNEEEEKIIDCCSSKIFLAAAQIASISMNKAATVTRMESERRLKEAVLSRKRARESIERVVFLANNATEKKKKKSPSPIPIPFPTTIPTPVAAATEPKKKSKGYSAVTAAVAAQKRIQNQYRAMGNNNKMATVGVASTNVLRKNEGLVRLNAPNVSQRPSTKVVLAKKNGELQSPEPKVNDKKSSNLAHLLTRVLQEEKDKNGLSSSPTTARQLQNPSLNDHDKDNEEKEVKSKPVADSGKNPS